MSLHCPLRQGSLPWISKDEAERFLRTQGKRAKWWWLCVRAMDAGAAFQGKRTIKNKGHHQLWFGVSLAHWKGPQCAWRPYNSEDGVSMTEMLVEQTMQPHMGHSRDLGLYFRKNGMCVKGFHQWGYGPFCIWRDHCDFRRGQMVGGQKGCWDTSERDTAEIWARMGFWTQKGGKGEGLLRRENN